MLKVHILDRCGECSGESMVFVGMDMDQNGQPFKRYRACGQCAGSGLKPRWVSLRELADLLGAEELRSAEQVLEVLLPVMHEQKKQEALMARLNERLQVLHNHPELGEQMID